MKQTQDIYNISLKNENKILMLLVKFYDSVTMLQFKYFINYGATFAKKSFVDQYPLYHNSKNIQI
jgi:hypothetical protein